MKFIYLMIYSYYKSPPSLEDNFCQSSSTILPKRTRDEGQKVFHFQLFGSSFFLFSTEDLLTFEPPGSESSGTYVPFLNGVEKPLSSDESFILFRSFHPSMPVLRGLRGRYSRGLGARRYINQVRLLFLAFECEVFKCFPVKKVGIFQIDKKNTSDSVAWKL